MADVQEEQQPQQQESQPNTGAAEPAAAASESAPKSDRPQQNRGPRPQGQQGQQANAGGGGGNRPPRGERREGGDRREGGNGGNKEQQRGGGPRGEDRRQGGDRRGGDRPGGDRREGPPEILLDKLMGDPLYLDDQAHGVVRGMRDMDPSTKSQLRRFYNAVRRACRAPEADRQHEFVMLRARLAYLIARHSLRSLDSLERLLLQVTRKNETRGYERFRDLFEAIVAYNE